MLSLKLRKINTEYVTKDNDFSLTNIILFLYLYPNKQITIMNKKNILFFSLFIAVTSQAQLKTFTLDEAVMQQNRAFRADKLLGFQWIPNTNRYVYYTDAGSKMMSASTNDSKAKELVTLTEVNTALETKLKSFTGLECIDANTNLISENNK